MTSAPTSTAQTTPVATSQARTARAGSSTFRRQSGTWVSRLIIWAIIIVMLFPVLYVVLFSLKGGAPSLYSPTLFPQSFTFEHYDRLLHGSFPTWAMNSLIYGLACALINVVFATLGGYAFSRLRFRGKRYGILALLIIQALPTNLAIVAYFKMLDAVGL